MEGEITDLETGADIPQDELIEAVRRYARLIEFLIDMESGAMVLTYKEYLMLPATFITARRVFKSALSQMKNKKP